MSASLVGSEMCIRDSLARLTAQPGPGAQAPPCQTAAERKDEAAGVGPVSYTHLTLPTICSV
eukprot:10368639-Alexandrium_andersonii.AAC.1